MQFPLIIPNACPWSQQLQERSSLIGQLPCHNVLTLGATSLMKMDAVPAVKILLTIFLGTAITAAVAILPLKDAPFFTLLFML